MFDFAWSEILLIGAVALIAIGPKDMPAAIRTASSMIKKARRMAAEFQTHVDEMVREADLGDVKKAFSDIRNLDIPSLLEKHVDPDHSIRDTFADNPLEPSFSAASEVSTLDEVAVSAPPILEPLSDPEAVPAKPLAPAFIPPGLVPPPPILAATPPAEAPAFIPPEAVLQRQSKG
ncbi:Sec-independent protein translocase protein TatB [Acidisphaera sp. S103]|uniref:Sec-independent protein translocase protein TatB n=1 Tax=Acidisphaera sp. S103 TaxID=1747223 RepID=UPI00131D0428|nr:Sec-independent protein translocase protein TatB [Acidisphaera sp. S103]